MARTIIANISATFVLTAIFIFAAPIVPSIARDSGQALLDAARDGEISKIEELIDKGVNINTQDQKGWTPLMFAVTSAHTKLADLLLTKGADANIGDKKGWTPLMKATEQCNREMIHMLLEKGAILDAKNINGASAYSLAESKCGKDVMDLFEDTK